MPLDVAKSDTLTAAYLGARQARQSIRSGINRDVKKEAGPLWVAEIDKRATTKLERAVLVPGARLSVGARNVTAYAARSGYELEGGLVPNAQYAGVEWGSDSHNQFRRRVWPAGYVAGPAAAAVISRTIAVWVRTIVDHFRAVGDVTK